jgi:hypothetical protein
MVSKYSLEGAVNHRAQSEKKRKRMKGEGEQQR